MEVMSDSLTNPVVSVGIPKGISPSRGAWISVFEFGHLLKLRVKIGLGLLAWLCFTLVWQSLSSSGIADPTLLPGPFKVFKAWVTLFAEREFLTDVIQSLKRIFSSFGIAIIIALPLGMLMGAFSPVAGFLNALVSPFRYLPAPSFVPLLLMWFGTGDDQKIALLVIGVVFFLISLFMDNTRAVSVELVECSRTLGATRGKVLWHILLPAALPSYVDTARQMLAVSWTYLVVAEIVAATDGIGAMMMRAKRFVQVDDIMAGIFTIGLLGLITDIIIRSLHRLSFKYLH